MAHLSQFDRLRLQRGVTHLHKLGERAQLEFLLAIMDRIGGHVAIRELLVEYERLTPGLVRAAGGDRFPPRPLHLVPPPSRVERRAAR